MGGKIVSSSGFVGPAVLYLGLLEQVMLLKSRFQVIDKEMCLAAGTIPKVSTFLRHSHMKIASQLR